MILESKRQHRRPNKFKPSVIKGDVFWLARVYDCTGEYVVDAFPTHQEAIDKAYEFAELNREVMA